MKTITATAVLLASLASLAAHAQSSAPLKESEITESALIEALAPYSQTRGLKPSARLKAVGKGDTEPLIPEDPAARENRRVTFVTQ